ncbi:MAG TPA: MFS transporter, partial [Novosphingobium sp.]|nr:MFS transporter [Novosphingobium sp.]
PVGRLVIMHHTPKERLMAAISSLIWPALIAPVLGPPLGGLITLHLGWRWIFYMNLPLGLVALVATLVLVPGTRGEDQRPFDWTGFGLCGTGTFALLLGLDRLVMRPDALSAGLIAAGFGLGWATLRHFGRAAHPMIGLKPWAIPTFRVSQSGGSLARMAIGSAPFLLPLMFQVGFGYDAFHSGLLVLAVFAGNLGMKSVTTPILRRFGYRQVMVWNGVINALLLGACALLTPATPAEVVVAVLFASGCARSMQFTAIGTVALADVPKAQMADANGLSNTLGQIAQAAGITLAALCIHAGEGLARAAHWPAAGGDYRIAFVLVALVALVSVRDAAALPRDAADHFISRRA